MTGATRPRRPEIGKETAVERFRDEMLGLLAGAVTGAVVLGLLGRLATAVLALVLGRNANLSARGIAEVLLVGAVIGAAGGLLLPMVRRWLPSWRRGHGAVTGLAMFVLTTVIARARGGLAVETHPVGLLTLAVAAVVFVVYGIALDRLWLWRTPPGEEA